MSRLIVLAVVLAAIVMMARALGRVVGVVQTQQEATVPDTVKKISYILLLVLMLGVVTGWLGGL